jgi:hypothetical protein
MTPQEKAKDLVEKFYLPNIRWALLHAKKCALIAVDEVLSIKKEIWDDFHREYFNYWQQVKAEIEKL